MQLSMETNVEPTSQDTTTTIAAAVIQYGGRYLLMKRAAHKGNGGMWEFPGGKVDPGESLQQAVIREIKEELNLKATTGKLLGSSETRDQNRVLRLFGIETFIEHEPKEFKDHSEFLWVRPENFSEYPMTPAEYGLLTSLKNNLNSEREILAVKIWSVAKVFGVLYGIMGLFVGAFMLVSSMALPIPLAMATRTIFALLIPFVNILFGLVCGTFLAVVYNLYSSVFGGIKIQVR
jgi:mutator protein MutT